MTYGHEQVKTVNNLTNLQYNFTFSNIQLLPRASEIVYSVNSLGWPLYNALTDMPPRHTN